jgi:hypothetical protein
MNPNDIVMTPVEVAKDIINFFKPSGTILDPCRGQGAFYDNLPGDKIWCELSEGVDFFKFNQKVDWIISNPPYSVFDKWLVHSLLLADNIVYLIPVNKVMSSLVKLKQIYEFGGIRHIRYYGTGRFIGFPFGFPVGAVHMQRGYKGSIEVSGI